MKFLFSLLLISLCFSPLKSEAREIILIENQASKKDGLILKKILIDKFNIPEDFIVLKNINRSCTKNLDAIMHLCLKTFDDLEILKLDKFVVENTLRTFTEMVGHE